MFRAERAQSVHLEKVTELVNAENCSQPYNSAEIMSALSAMMDDNQVMVSDDIVFLI